MIIEALNDSKPNTLIAIGATILIGSILSEAVNDWLKVVACRPRYRYLVTLEDPISEFKNWWQMLPYIKDESNFRSWPSGHMTEATIMLTLPMLGDVLKYRSVKTKYYLATFAVVFLIIMGYNRLHMQAHFLTDVCFGTLISYAIYALVYKACFSDIA